jgi:DNA-binding beta-propeller fold protein YncE
MAAVPSMIAVGLTVLLETADTTLVEQYRFGQFTNATRITTDLLGRIAVIDEADESVSVFADDRSVPVRIGGFGWAAGSFDTPSGVASDGINLFVADRGNHRIQRFDRSLAYLSSLMTRDSTDAGSRFGYPRGVAVTPRGDLLVLDGENRRLVRFDANGRYDAAFVPAAPARATLTDPVKVVSRSDGRIVVAERGRLIEMDEFGSVLRTVSHAWLDSVRGLGCSTGAMVAVTPRGLIFVGDDGKVTEVPNGSILAADADGTYMDVAFAGERVYLLTTHAVVCCRIP